MKIFSKSPVLKRGCACDVDDVIASQVRVANAEGSLPLHKALRHGAPPELVLKLVHLFPGAILTENRGNELPIHFLWRRGKQFVADGLGTDVCITLTKPTMESSFGLNLRSIAGGDFFVHSVCADTPADGKIQPGCRLQTINGRTVKSMTRAAVMELIRSCTRIELGVVSCVSPPPNSSPTPKPTRQHVIEAIFPADGTAPARAEKGEQEDELVGGAREVLEPASPSANPPNAHLFQNMNCNGELVLHCAIRYGGTEAEILVVLAACPRAAMCRTYCGELSAALPCDTRKLPLQLALEHAKSDAVIMALVDANPAAATVLTATENLSMVHIACAQNYSRSVLDALNRLAPDAALDVSNVYGQTPGDYAITQQWLVKL